MVNEWYITAAHRIYQNRFYRNTHILLNLVDYKLKILEKIYMIDGEKASYFSKEFLSCKAELSKKESIKIIKLLGITRSPPPRRTCLDISTKLILNINLGSVFWCQQLYYYLVYVKETINEKKQDSFTSVKLGNLDLVWKQL